MEKIEVDCTLAWLKDRIKNLPDNLKVVARDREGNLIPVTYAITDSSNNVIILGSGTDHEVESLLCHGMKILAIKLYRERTNCGLMQAKTYVEDLQKRLEGAWPC